MRAAWTDSVASAGAEVRKLEETGAEPSNAVTVTVPPVICPALIDAKWIGEAEVIVSGPAARLPLV